MGKMLSVICPSFNSCGTVRTLIESVLDQTCPDVELIIVDGGSTDGTLSILKEYEGRLRFVSEADKGIYDAMNKGIRMAEGDWLYFSGCDDSMYSKDAVERIQPYMTDDTDVIMCDIMSPKLGRCSSQYSWLTYLKNTIHHQGVIYRKEIFSHHLYDSSFRIMADYEMNLYVRSQQFSIRQVPLIFAYHAATGVSGQVRWINYREEMSIRNRYLGNPLLRFLCAVCSIVKFTLKRIKSKM